MTDEVGATTVLLVGALLVRLAVTGAYERYVRAGMGPWLLVAGILLVLLGLFGVVRALRGTATEDSHEHHGHERAGWLLLIPVVALLLVAPPALGSFGVDRNTVVAVSSGGRTFASLSSSEPVPMTLLEYDERAADHDGASFGTVRVQLTGFVARVADGDGFRLARYQIQCCAADAVAAVARVVGASGDLPARDQWVTVTGTYHGSPGGIPELLTSIVSPVPPPRDPYE